MSPAAADTVAEITLRPLAASDVQAVVAIDAASEGRTRHDYFERRLAAARREPELHAQFAADDGQGLAGFIITTQPVVDPGAGVDHLGHALDGEGGACRQAYATESARQAAVEKFDAVFASGGDGTIGQVAAGLVGTEAALGILPSGTANVLALEFGLPVFSWARWWARRSSCTSRCGEPSWWRPLTG